MLLSRNFGLGLAIVPVMLAPAEASFDISAHPTNNVSCSGGVCTPTAPMANLNATDLANMLATSDVTLAKSAGVKDIFVKASFSWTSTNRLTLDAYRSITVELPVVVAGPGRLTLTTSDGGKFGALSFGPKGRIAFWDLSSSLTINGNVFTPVSGIAGMASAIAANSAGNYALADDVHSTTTYAASPIPTTFTGRFEGLGNRIFYLTIDDNTPSRYDGLFATIAVYASVRDLGLVGAKVHGTSGSRIGALAGENDGTIANSYSTGRVTHSGNTGYLGGLVGWHTGALTYSYSAALVSGGYNVSAGGLVGTFPSSSGMATTTIEYCHATGAVSGGKQSYVGGLVGTNYFGVGLSYATGSATAGYGSLVGGLAGQSPGFILASFATGAVSVGNNGSAGGLAGAIGFGTGFPEASDVYATGNVSGQTSQLGSLFGTCCSNPHMLVDRAYGIGTINGAPQATIGGVVGDDGQQGRFTDAYWDTDTTGVGNLSQGAGNVASDPGLTGLSDVQLKSALPSGFSPPVWGQDASINNGYPYLIGITPQ